MPAVNRALIQLPLAFLHMCNLESKSIKFVIAFLQVALDIEVCIEIPFSFEHYCDNKV